MHDFDHQDDGASWPACPGWHAAADEVPGAPVWCAACSERIRRCVEGLPAAYADLASTREIPTRPREILRAPSPEPGSPSREVDHADEILRTVCAWDDALRQHLEETRRWWDVDHRGTGRDLEVAVEYLLEHHSAALCAPFGVDYGREILALGAAADRLRGAGDSPLRPARVSLDGVLCPDCGRQGLYEVTGTDQVECRHCGASGSRDEYDAHTRLLVAEFGDAPLTSAPVRAAPLVDGRERDRRSAWGRPSHRLSGVLSMDVRMPVTVLLVVGDQAELTTPDRDHRGPERVSAAWLSRETGIPVAELPGKRLTALVSEAGELVGFEA